MSSGSDKKCCVPGCVANEGSLQVLHSFPNPEKERVRFNNWVKSIGGDILGLNNAHIHKYRRVCHAHFETKYLCRFNRISKDAVPTLNMPGNKSQSQLPTDIRTEDEKNPDYQYEWLVRTLQFKNIPYTWKKPEVEAFIKKYTDGRSDSCAFNPTELQKFWATRLKNIKRRSINYIRSRFESGEISEGIEEVRLEKNEENSTTRLCLVTFTTARSAREARILLKDNLEPIKPPIISDYYRPVIDDEDIKTETSRSRSRSPLSTHNPLEDENEGSCRVLVLTNMPLTWNKSHVEQFIKQYTYLKRAIIDNVQHIFMITEKAKPVKQTGQCVILFASPEICKEAKLIFERVPPIEDKKICVEYDYDGKFCIWTCDGKPDYQAMNLKAKRKRKKMESESVDIGYKQIFQNDVMPISEEQQSNHNYGLCLDLINSLDIKPPFVSRIFVSNLSLEYDDEEKIRKLFSHAGMVMSVAIVARLEHLKVRVEYDHPVEAVQAISMFNNQEVYGNRLKVEMDRTRNATKRSLPEGLKAFGPGLGPKGLPMKGVRAAIELQNVKSMIMSKIANIKQENSYHGRDDNSEYSENQAMRQQSQPDTGVSQQVNQNPAAAVNPLASLANTLANPLQNNPLLAIGTLLDPQVTQVLQLLAQQTSGDHLSTVSNTSESQGPNTETALSEVGGNMDQVSDFTQNRLHGKNPNMPRGCHIQVGPNIQSGSNMQGKPNLQAGQNMQSGLMKTNIQMIQSPPQGCPTNQGGHNTMQMQSVTNTQGRPNMQRSPHAETGQKIQLAHNMQAAWNIQSGFKMQTEPNMQTGPYIQGAQRIQAGPNILGGTNMHDRPNLHRGLKMEGQLYVQSGPSTMPGHTHKYNYDDINRKEDNDPPCTVMFNYLPPSVTLLALKKKMKEIGEIKLAEITEPGRAVVVFYHPQDAEACIELLDHTKVDGQTIDVRYL